MKATIRLAGIFLLAAALALSLRAPRGSADPFPVAIPKGFVWGVSWHPETLKEGETSNRQLDDIGELGCGLLRFDARWKDIQPDPGELDEKKIVRLREIAAEATRRGFQLKVNLGSYPNWALDLLRKDPENFFSCYRQYVKAVVSGLDENISYYQLGNEFNTILDPIPAEYDSRVFREARLEIDQVKKNRPNWKVKTVINACDSFYLPWKKTLEKALDEASSSIDVIGYDFYPGNYCNFTDWSAWQEIPYLTELMKKYDKEAAICETGCPTIFGENRQARWIKESTRGMMKAIAASPLKDRFLFAVFYEYADSPAGLIWPPPSEATFGITTLEGRRKPGFEAFKKLISQTVTAQRATGDTLILNF
jgi:hypothetical protein